jgi:hypothetical protein
MASNRPGAIKSEQPNASRSFLGMRQQQFGMLNEMQARGRQQHNRAISMQQASDAYANQPPIQLSGFMQSLMQPGGGALLLGGQVPSTQIPTALDIPNRQLETGPFAEAELPGISELLDIPHPRRREGAVERLRGDVRGHPPDIPEDPSGGIGEAGDIVDTSERRPYPPNKTNTLKEDIIDGIKGALGISDPAPYYVPNKINRDTGRLQNINRVPPSKTWSIAELEYYNRKGYVNYKVKNVEGKHLPTKFDPRLPVLGLERRPPTTTYNKPGMYASLEREHQPSRIPTSFLVA